MSNRRTLRSPTKASKRLPSETLRLSQAARHANAVLASAPAVSLIIDRVFAALEGNQPLTPSAQRAALADLRRLDGRLDAVLNCRAGDGPAFERAVQGFLCEAIAPMVFGQRARRQVESKSRTVDIEIPIRTDRVRASPTLYHWYTTYGARLLVIECKNSAARAPLGDPSAVGQVSTAQSSRTGRVGFVCSRNGFTSKALDAMAELASSREALILPFDLPALQGLADAAKLGEQRVDEFFANRELDLLQRVA